MRNIFQLKESNRVVRSQYKLNVEVPTTNQIRFGDKSLRYYGAKMWNSLPLHLKSSNNLEIFKKLIKNWNGVSCICSICEGQVL